MSPNDSIHNSDRSILVEGPKWGDAEFYGKWLRAAAKADALWKEAIKDPSFKNQIYALTLECMPDFGIGATIMFFKLDKNFSSFAIQLNSREEGIDLVDEFVMMVEIGFFILTGERYQMAIPTQLNMDVVKKAALKFSQTEDEEFYLHPEHLVATMPYAEAKAWQGRLRTMDSAHRCADRLLLLEDVNGAG